MNQPFEYVSGRNGVTTDTFAYFPEHHYQQGFEQLRGTVSDTTLDEWMDQVIGHTPVEASHGGLWKEKVPDLVDTILTSDRGYESRITIEPEPRPDGYDYVVEWQRIAFDRDDYEWKPVTELESGDGR